MNYQAKQSQHARSGDPLSSKSVSRRLLGSVSLAAAVVALGAGTAAHAEERHWDPNGTAVGTGGSGTWDLGSLNWSPSGDGVSGPYNLPWNNAALDDAIFGGTGGTIALGAPITVHNLTFNSANYVLTGNTLTLAGVTPTISNNGNLTIQSVIAGSSGLTKIGGGNLSLAGVNTLTGGIYLNQGGIVASSDAALGAASNIINIADGASVRLSIGGADTSREIRFGNGGVVTLGGSGVGSALITGNGRVSVGNSVTLSNDASTYTGSTTFNGLNGVAYNYFTSIADLGVASSLGAPVTVSDGTIVFNQSSQYSDNVIYLGDGDSSNRNWELYGAAAIIRNRGTGTLSITGNILTSGSSNFIAETADIELLGTLSGGNYSFGTNAGRTLTLGGANTYTGTSVIGGLVKASVLANGGVASSLGAGAGASLNAGTLSYTGTGSASNRTWEVSGASGILNDGTGALNLTGNATFLPGNPVDSLTLGGSFASENTFSGVLSGAGALTSSGNGTWVLGGANTFTGSVTVNAGTLRAGNASAFGTPTGFIVNGGTLDLGGYDLLAPSLTGTGGLVALGASNLTVKATNSQTFGGSITGTGGLSKTGAGTLALTGTSNYTGATTIAGGRLELDFSGAGGPVSGIISASSPLILSGGTLHVLGADSETNSQSFNGLNVMAGSNTVRAINGAGGIVNVSLGAISRTGGLVNFALPTSGAISTSNADGLLGGWATVNGTDYAKVVSGNILAFDETDYTDKDDAGTWITGDIISDTANAADTPFFGTVASNVQLGGLRYTAAADSTVTIGAGNTLGVDGTIIIAPSTLATNQTIIGGSLTGGTGGGALGFQHNGTGAMMIASTIVDNGGATSLVKGGTGTLSLTGLNSYTGSTTLTAGVLQVSSIANGGAASSIGASSADSANLVLEAGTLLYTGATTSTDRGFTLVNGGPARTIDVVGGTNLTFTGEVTSPDDAGFTKLNIGTLTLANAANTYSGVTIVGGGTLAVSTLTNGGLASSIGMASSDPANIVLAGGTLDYLGATASSDRGITIGAGNGGVGVTDAGAVLTLAGTITSSGTGGLRKEGAGTLILSGTNSYAGFTTVNAGTLVAGSAQAFGPGTASMTVNSGATLDLGGFNVRASGVAGDGAINLGANTLTTAGGSAVFTGTITGTGGFTRGAGNFTQTLSGCNNTYTGVTTVSGLLSVDCIANGGEASSIGASSADSANLVLNGDWLNYTGGSVTTDRGFTAGASTAYLSVIQADTTLEFTGAAVGTGGLHKQGAGTLVLSGANSYAGGTTIRAGTLRAGSAQAFGATNAMALYNVAGATLDLGGHNIAVSYLTGGGAVGGVVDLGGNDLTITNGHNSASVNYAGAITGTGNLIKNGNATQRLSGCASDYSGTTTINGGTIEVTCLIDGGLASSIGSSSADPGSLILSGGTLRYVGAATSTNRQFTLGASGGNALDASGTGAINFTSAAPLTFSGTNTAQTLTLTGTNTGNNTLAAQITNNGTGVTALTKTGTGTWILSNPDSTYTGPTTILGGVLGVDKLSNGGVASSLGASSADAANLVIGNESTLRYTGAGDTTDRLFTLAAGVSFIESSGTGAVVFTDTGAVTLQGNNQSRVIALGGTNTGNNTLAGSISDAGTGVTTLAKNDSGNWVLTGNNTFTGNTVINDGNLTIGNGGTTGNAGTGNVFVTSATSTLSFNRSDTFSFTGAISGVGGIAQIGSGTTVLTATNSIGAARIDDGVLQVDGALGTATFAMNGDGALTVNGTVEGATAGSISTFTGDAGASMISVNAGGMLRASGDLGDGNDVFTLAGTLDTGGTALNLGDGDDVFTLNDGGVITGSGVNAGAGTDSLIVDNAIARTLDGASITAFESLAKQNSGLLTLTGDHSYSNGTTIAAGTLRIGNGGASGTLAGDIANNSTLEFNRSDTLTIAGEISGSGSVEQLGSGTTILTADNAYTGGTTITNGALQLGNGGTSGFITGDVANDGSLIFNRSDNVGFGGLISGTGSVTQNGAGVVTLTTANSYTGATAVNAGTLLINGDQSAATGLTSVASGATLGGIGTIGGNVSIASGGILTAGSNDVGTLSIAGGLTLDSGSILNMEFGQADVAGGALNDLIEVGGELVLDGTINVTETAGGTFGGGIYRVFNYGGALTDNGLTLGTMPAGSSVTVQTSVAGQVNLINSAGLSLSFWDGDGGPKFNDVVNGGNGIWHLDGVDNNWTDAVGGVNAAYADGTFAIFAGTGGTVTVDNTGGAVTATGMQFASDSYLIAGDALTLVGPESTIRVGDGTALGAGYTATIDADLTGTTQLVKTDLGTLVLSGANSYTGGTLINEGTLNISSNDNLGEVGTAITINNGTLHATAGMTTGRAITLTGAATLSVEPGVGFIVNGVIDGSGSLTKAGGLVMLGADNIYTGGTTITEGTLQIGLGGTTGSIVGDVVNNAALVFNRGDALTYAGAISGTGQVRQGGPGATTLTGENSYTGGTRITAGTLQLGDGGTSGSIVGDVANAGLLVFNRSDELTFAGVISGAGDVNHNGTGTTILTGSNAYTGATNVNAGLLVVNGDQSGATGLTSVSTGATLGGIGIIGGDVTVADGGVINPGDVGLAPGALGIAGNLGLAATAALDYNFGQADVVGGPLNDLINVGGDLTLDGTLNVNTSAGGIMDVGVYRVINYAGSLTNNGLSLGTVPSADLYVQTSIPGQVNLVNTSGLTLRFWDGDTIASKNSGTIEGGNGLWQSGPLNDNWTEDTGALNAPFSDGDFAVFMGAAGTVTVDTSLGDVNTSGMQFLTDGYVIEGDAINLVGAPASTIRVGDGTAAGAGITATIASELTGAAQLVKADLGTLVLTGANSYTGGTAINGGILQIASDANLGDAAGGLSFNNGATLNTTADITTARAVDLVGDGNFLTDTGTALTLDGAITGTGGFTKSGAGTLILTAANSYTGATNVAEGNMFVNGDQSGATGLTSVLSGATLGGTGIIGGDVTIGNGATLAAGMNGIGTLGINGNLALAGGSVLDFEFGEANVAGGALNDLVNVGGDLVLDGTINVTVPTGGSFGPGIYRVFNYGGTLTDNGLELGTMPIGSVAVQTAINGQVNLVNTAGLTLSFWDGMVGPKNNNAVNGGDGIWRVGGGSNNWTDMNGAVNADYAQDSFAVFSAAAGTVTIDNSGGAVLASGMQFASDGYTITGDALTLTGADAIIQVGDGSAASAGYIAAIDAALAGSAQLIKTDAGTLVLTGTNTYSGGTAINGGTLQIASDANLGDAASGLAFDGGTLATTADMASTRTVDLAGSGTFLTDGNTTLTLGGVVTGVGSLTKDGSGTLVLTADADHAGGTTITAGTLQLGDGSTSGGISGDVLNNGTFAFNRSDNVTFGGAISGSGNVDQIGTGTTILTADNSYSGGTTIAAGTLQLGNGGTSGAIIGDVVNNGALAFNRSNDLGFSGSISGSGGLDQIGSGTTILTAANSYVGATNVNGGTLLINGDQSAATGLTSVALGATLGGTGTIGGDVAIGSGTLAAGSDGVGMLTIAGNLSLDSGSILAFEFGEANVVGGPLNDLVNVGGDLTLDGTVDVAVPTGGSFAPGVYRMIDYTGTLTDNGLELGAMPGDSEAFVQTVIGGQVNLVNTAGLTLSFWDGAAGPKNNGAINGGDGIWQVGGGNNNWTEASGAVNADYAQDSFAIFQATPGTVTVDNSAGAVLTAGMQFASGGYTITGDALMLTGADTLIRVGDGSAADADYIATIDAELTGTARLVKDMDGTLVLTGTNTYSGGTAINGGTLQIASDANLGAAAGGLSFNGGTLHTTADITSTRAVDLVGTGTFLTDGNTTLTLGGPVTGAGSLTKDGAGMLVLTGAGSNAGGMNVTDGSLLVNGDFGGATGAVNVASGATLGGTGTIGGNVAIADGAVLMPGAGGAGTLAIGGNLELASGSTLAFEFGEANVAGGGLNDLVTVGGDLTLDGTINVSVPAGGAFGAGVYRVFNYAGALTNNGLSLGALPAGDVTVQTSISGQVNLVNGAGLMLNFWDGAAGPKNNGAINGGDGIWQNSTGNDNWTDDAGAVNAVYSDGTFAVFGGTGGAVTVDGSLGDVTSGGMQFATDGYTIDGDTIILTGAATTIRVGDGSADGAGYTATIGSELSGNSQLVKTDAGTLILTGVNSYTGGTAIYGGTLQIASDANLGASAGGLTLNGGTLATSSDLTSARDFVLDGNGTIATAADTTFTYDGLLSGSGALTKQGTGTLLLTGDNSGYTAVTTVAAGTLGVDGVLGSAVTVNAGTRLEGNGQVGSVTNSGTVAVGRDGLGTFTVAGSYVGAGGVLEIETVLGGDSSATDRLVISGGTSGSTELVVTNRGGLGAQTIEGIKIIDVTGGASDGDFQLRGDYIFEGSTAIIAGAYGYRLSQGGASTPTDGDWYLRSQLLDGGGEPDGPLYQPGVPIYENYGQTLQALNSLPTLQERVGNRRWAASESGASNGIWGRMESTRYRPDARVSTAGTDADTDSWKMQVGVDRALVDTGGNMLVAGITAHYGEADTAVQSIFGNGTIKAKSHGIGATLTWYDHDGFYADAQAQFAWFDGKLESSVLGTLADDNDGTGQAFGLEVGKQSVVGKGLTLTPQIQMTYQNAEFDTFTDPSEAVVSTRKGDSLKTRWGMSIDHQKHWENAGSNRRSHLYGLVNLSYEWLDGTQANVSGTSINNINDRFRGEVALGGSLGLNDGLTIYTQISAGSSIRNFGDDYSFKGTAGVRLAF